MKASISGIVAPQAKHRSLDAHLSRRTRGFTLVEILVVLVIIAILAGLAFRLLGTAGTQARIARTQVLLKQLDDSVLRALSALRQDFDRVVGSIAEVHPGAVPSPGFEDPVEQEPGPDAGIQITLRKLRCQPVNRGLDAPLERRGDAGQRPTLTDPRHQLDRSAPGCRPRYADDSTGKQPHRVP